MARAPRMTEWLPVSIFRSLIVMTLVLCAALSCQHPDPGKQFIKIKRFDKIIIRSQIQPGDPVRNAVTGSQE